MQTPSKEANQWQPMKAANKQNFSKEFHNR